MIRHFEVKSFKSLRETSLDFGNINIFIGANGAGKTNILEALGVVSAAAYGIVDDESLLRRGIRACTRRPIRPIRYRRIFLLWLPMNTAAMVFLY